MGRYLENILIYRRFGILDTLMSVVSISAL